MTRWTEKQVQQLKEEGRIVDYKDNTKKPENNSQNQPKNIPKKRNKTKEWIALNLSAWCVANHFTLIPEYTFYEGRKWRADFFIKELNCLLEYEGLMSAKSRHTTVQGYSDDTEKYTAASIKGFIVVRITAMNYKSLFTHLEEIKNRQ